MGDVQVAGAMDPGPPDTGTRPWPATRRLDGLLAAIVAAGCVLRLWRLGAQSLWYDEWVTTEATGGGLIELGRHVATREGAGPVYFVLVWSWARVVGDGDAALRSLSALLGVATVPVAYAVARELGQPRRVANGAALLVAANPALVWYSQEARPYSLLVLAGATTVWAAVRADRRGRKADVLVWGVAAGAAVAVHYVALLLVAGEAVGLLVRRRVPRRTVALGTAPVLVALVALAPLVAEQRAHGANQAWITGFGLAGRLEEAGRLAAVGPSPATDWLWLVPVGAVGLAALVTVGRPGRRGLRAALALVALAGLSVAVLLAAVVVGIDAVLGRYLLGAWVPLLVAVAIVLLAPARPWPGALAIAVVVTVWTVTAAATAVDPARQRADWRAVAGVVAEGGPGTVLVVDAHGAMSRPLHRYLPSAEILPDTGTTLTDEVDVLVARRLDVPCDYLVGRACAHLFLGTSLTGGVGGDFRFVERVTLDDFVVERYRSARPVPVGRDDLLTPGRRAGGAVWAA